MSRKNCNTQKFTRMGARRYFPTPALVACEVAGIGGYWRAVHANGLVQTIHGSRQEAQRAVDKVVSRMNAFEDWCRRRSINERHKLL